MGGKKREFVTTTSNLLQKNNYCYKVTVITIRQKPKRLQAQATLAGVLLRRLGMVHKRCTCIFIIKGERETLLTARSTLDSDLISIVSFQFFWSRRFICLFCFKVETVIFPHVQKIHICSLGTKFRSFSPLQFIRFILI